MNIKTAIYFRNLIFLSLIVFANPVLAKTYYVSVIGNDANPGTRDRPWANPQRCVDPDSPLQPGDACEVGNGNYSSTTSGRVIVAGGSAPSGSPGMPISIRAENPGQVRIDIPNTWPGVDCNLQQCTFAGFYITRPYYRIEGFEIVGTGIPSAQKSTISGIILAPGHGAVINRNDIHDIASNVCHDNLDASGNENQAILLLSSANVTIEKNRFYSIGRRRNGESGCITNKEQHDHGINANTTRYLTIRHNLSWDIIRGVTINVKAAIGQTAGLKIVHNTIVGSSPTGVPGEQIRFSNTLHDVQIVNNIFYNPPNGYAIGWTNSTKIINPPGVLVANNLTNSIRDETHFTNPSYKALSGIRYKDNITGSNPTFVDPKINEFRLRSGSRAINNGMSLPGILAADGSPDIGAYTFMDWEPLGTGKSGTGTRSNLGMSRPRGCI